MEKQFIFIIGLAIIAMMGAMSYESKLKNDKEVAAIKAGLVECQTFGANSVWKKSCD